MTNATVAIIQNRIIRGGRFHVIAGIIKTLNQKGIIPDVITIKSKVNKDEAEQFYGEKIEFRLKEILFDLKLPADYHILFFNFFVRFYLKRYRLVINSSNSSFFLPAHIPLLSYVHYPRKDRLLSEKLSIHFRRDLLDVHRM